jgi:hypothetical protein
MAKQRGYPDRRGMGAESDAISEVFVPDERYKAQQKAIAETLAAAGLNQEKIASMLFVPVDLPPAEKAKAEKEKDEKPLEEQEEEQETDDL